MNKMQRWLLEHIKKLLNTDHTAQVYYSVDVEINGI